MTELAHDFRSWILDRESILRRALGECDIQSPDEEHLRIVTPKAVAHVNFYELDPGAPEVVELNVIPEDDPDNPSFFLHFEMDDADHARELFDQLCEALSRESSSRVTRILLSCTSGLTTSLFARKLAELAPTLSLDFEFKALPIDQAIREAGGYDAVMLAPQVHMRRDEMVRAHPDLVVFEIPGAVFGAYDAGTALRMLLNALSENALAARMEQASARIVRTMDNDRRILVISAVYGTRGGRDSLYSYRLYDHGEVALDGRVSVGRRDYRDVGDILAGVRLKGVDLSTLDAIGLALPGMVDDGVVRMVVGRSVSHDFSGLAEKLGVPVFVDNNANAAAAGCYMGQETYENILLHRQPTGYSVGGEGHIIDGRLVRGSHGLAGELGYLTRMMGKTEELHGMAWTSEGMRRIVAEALMCNIVTTSPEAIYVAVDLVPDMGELHDELARHLPEGTVPELVRVCDYHERVLMGEYALCLNALRQAEADNQ